jgi:hypothetical protein
MTRARLLNTVILAALLVTGLSCSPDMGPTAPKQPAQPTSSLLGSLLDSPLLSPLSPLLKCNPLPYAADTEVVGPEGGTLVVGPHRLVIPAGALDQPVRIIAELPTDTVNSVRFQPEGLQFKRAARLTLDYNNCPLVRNLLPKRIAYTTESLNILSYLLSIDDLLRRKVSANIKHFSRYAVAW